MFTVNDVCILASSVSFLSVCDGGGERVRRVADSPFPHSYATDVCVCGHVRSFLHIS